MVTLRHSDLQPTVLQKEQLKADLQGSFAHCNPASHETNIRVGGKTVHAVFAKGAFTNGEGGGGRDGVAPPCLPLGVLN